MWLQLSLPWLAGSGKDIVFLNKSMFESHQSFSDIRT